MEVQESEEDFLKKKWYTVVDGIVGGYAVASINMPFSEMDYRKGQRHWIECASKECADHIVKLHNKDLLEHE